MTAIAEKPETITLTPQAYDYVMELFDKGADKEPIPVEKGVNGNLFTELKKKNVVDRDGSTPGRNSKPGTVYIKVPKDSLERGNSRAPRGSKGGSQPSSGTRKTREPNPNDDYLASGAVIIQSSEIQNIKDSLLDYLAETTPSAQREYELRRSRKTSPSEIARLANQWDKENISDEEVGKRLTELLSAKDTPFHTYLVGKYGRKMVHILGYRDDVPDEKDAKPSVADSAEVTPPRSNGKTTASKGAPAARKR